MFLGLRMGLRPGEPARRRVAPKAVVAVESLEGKLLLSHAGAAQTTVPTAGFGLPGTLQVNRLNQPGPILNEIGIGQSVKVARFYKYYTGAFRGELNATGSKAQVVGDQLNLTGIVGGKIAAKPTSAAREAFYYFGINRGGATGTGPFPGRPRINFDALVIVGVTQQGSAAVVQTSGSSITSLDPSLLKLGTDNVKVSVPLSLLPTTGAPASQYRVSFFPASEAPLTRFNSIASFAPEGRTIRVSTAR